MQIFILVSPHWLIFPQDVLFYNVGHLLLWNVRFLKKPINGQFYLNWGKWRRLVVRGSPVEIQHENPFQHGESGVEVRNVAKTPPCVAYFIKNKKQKKKLRNYSECHTFRRVLHKHTSKSIKAYKSHQKKVLKSKIMLLYKKVTVNPLLWMTLKLQCVDC